MSATEPYFRTNREPTCLLPALQRLTGSLTSRISEPVLAKGRGARASTQQLDAPTALYGPVELQTHATHQFDRILLKVA